MTLKQKREIVRRFKDGITVYGIAKTGPDFEPKQHDRLIVENVLRDYINGKFTLEPKRKLVEGCSDCEREKRGKRK